MKTDFLDIWEIEPNFKCPVVGAILSVEKHKSILKRCGYNVKNMKPYEYHQVIMGKLADKNSVSLKVNNFVKHQADKFMKKISGMEPGEIFKLWKETLKNGETGPLLFAIVSKKDTDPELLIEAYGDIHMLSHSNMTEVFDIRKKLVLMENNLKSERDKQIKKNDEVKKIIAENKSLRSENAVLARENDNLKNREESESAKDIHDVEKSELKAMINELKDKIRGLEEDILFQEREKKSLEIEFLSTKNENSFLKQELDSFISNFKAALPAFETENHCEGPSCPKYQLCAKRIFMVGGMTKMKSMYKKIVEKAGGEFYYDDGYFKNKNSNLEAYVKKSDVVICPVNCNSHNACLKVKKLCNRYNKKVKFLNSSSLTSVTQALFETDQQTAN